MGSKMAVAAYSSVVVALMNAFLIGGLTLPHLNSQQLLHHQHFHSHRRTQPVFPAAVGPAFDPEWYRKTIFYQVYPTSFQDGNGDGTGDLIGITQRLQHFVDIGVGAVWLSPIYASPMVDNGYDISNFYDINPLFGTLDDFRTLLAKVKELGLRLIMDLVPNHSSVECDWFNKSRHRIEPYTDYYVWHEGNPNVQVEINGKMRNGVPNNWASVFDGSAWEWDEVRQEYYYHAFLVPQADLNYRSEALKAEMKNVLKFWFDLGVDGFRVDAYNHAVEALPILNNNETHNPNSNVNDPRMYNYYNHELIEDRPETFENLVDWRNFITDYVKKNNRDHIFLVTECYEADVTVAMQYDTYKGQKAADFTFNFNFINVTNLTSGHDIARAVQVWLDFLPEGSWPNWVVGNHDNRRIADRIGMNLVDVMNTLTLTLPGTPFTYYGEEIGMTNNYNITKEQVQDKAALTPEHEAHWELYTRDYQRTPMQWKNIKPNADFTSPSETPYLPINQNNLATVNVGDEEANSHTHLQVYKQLAALRKTAAFSDNAKLEVVLVDDNTFAFLRQSDSDETDIYLVIVDMRRQTNLPVKVVDLRGKVQGIKDFAIVQVADVNSYYSIGLQDGTLLATNGVPMVPGGALVLKL